MGWLEGYVAIVTGGGSGLGLAIARRYVAEGAFVVVVDRDAERVAAAEEELGASVRGLVGDVTQPDTNVAATTLAIDAFGSLDVVVANAGTWDFMAPLADTAIDALASGFDQLFSVNVRAGVLAAKASHEALADSGGSMIFTLSNAALYPGGGGVLYTASKHALVGLVRQLAAELAPDVRVNGVAPGGMATSLTGPAALGLDGTIVEAADMDDDMRTWSPLGIAPKPEDYTGHYVLLASRTEARTVTGAIHVCDGGGQARV